MFSCMASRAIHVELTFSMSTSSFIQALRRFACRRGDVKYVTCDNGSNFVGAQKELKLAIQEWNQQEINRDYLQREISWTFNPTCARHFGGHSERHINTIRKVLNSIFNEQNLRLCDKTLLTVMCEVEAIINNRPLTELCSNVSDNEPLTPNHVLLMNSQVTFPPGLSSKEDSYLRRRWIPTQYLANLFWTRWKK